MLSECDSKIAVDDAHSFDGPHDEVAYDIHGYYVLKSNKMVHSGCFYLPPLKRKREHCFHSMGGQIFLKRSSTSTYYMYWFLQRFCD